MTNLNTSKGAIFSDCGTYRFLLWRIWNVTLPKVLFIGLNLSTADNTKDDATTKKVVSFAKNHGFGGVFLANCFPYIATDPKQLIDFSHHQENDGYLRQLQNLAKEVVFAWGNFPIVAEKERDKKMHRLFPNAKVLAFNKNGTPKHPLYVPLNTRLNSYYKPYSLKIL